MQERDIEKYLSKQVKGAGGKSFKWTSPGNAGVPDRIVILPEGLIYFVELKAPGQKLRPLQVKRANDLKKLGCRVLIIDSKERVDNFIKAARLAPPYELGC